MMYNNSKPKSRQRNNLPKIVPNKIDMNNVNNNVLDNNQINSNKKKVIFPNIFGNKNNVNRLVHIGKKLNPIKYNKDKAMVNNYEKDKQHRKYKKFKNIDKIMEKMLREEKAREMNKINK